MIHTRLFSFIIAGAVYKLKNNKINMGRHFLRDYYKKW